MNAPTTAATAQQAIERLAALPPLQDVGIALMAIGPSPDGDLSGFKIELTVAAQQDIAGIAEDTRKQVSDATLLAYGPAVLIPPQHWMHVTRAEAATLSEVEGLVHKQDLLPFDAKATHAPTIKMLAARFTTADQRVVTFFRIADSLLQLRKAKVIGLTWNGNAYGRLDPADVLLIRADFDVVVIDGYAFFNKKLSFERAFGFLDQLKAESLGTFNTVTSQLHIQGLDALRAACTSQTQMMAKMSSIKRNLEGDAEYANAMTMPKLIKYIEKHPYVDIEIVGNGSNRELVFDPRPARRFQILKLLDDDFLHSILTARDYEAGSKTKTSTP